MALFTSAIHIQKVTMKYVRDAPDSYKPYVFPNLRAMNTFLAKKTIINQTDRVLTGPQIEALCLGLNFITNDRKLDDPEITNSTIKRFTKSINTAIHFAEFDERTDKIKKPSPRGHLAKHISSQWEPETKDWQKLPAINQLWAEYRNNSSWTIPKPGTPVQILQAIKQLKEDPAIYITSADKGGGIVLWEAAAYKREALRQLSDEKTYSLLNENTMRTSLKNLGLSIFENAENLHHFKRITEAEKIAIRDNAKESPSPIYFLPKIHKAIQKDSLTFAGRPIVATYASPCHLLDKYLTELTRPLLPRIEGSLRDTTHLLNLLPSGTLPNNTRITTADVSSLYTSIPWDDGIDACTAHYESNYEWLKRHFKEKIRLEPPPPARFRILLKIVLQNSYIHFQNKKYYHQIKGTAMGCCISVYFANTYMYATMEEVIRNKPSHAILLLRFIDDILLISTGSDEEIKSFFDGISNRHISYEITTTNLTGDFLDLTIFIDPTDHKIYTKPYSKPSAVPFFVHAKSMHPTSTINSIPFAQLLRIKRNSSTNETYTLYANKLIRDFKLRGYSKWILKKAKKKCDETSRASLLLPTDRTGGNIANSFKIIRPYGESYNWKVVKQIINEIYANIQHFYEPTKYHPIFENNKASLVFSAKTRLGANFTKAIKNPT